MLCVTIFHAGSVQGLAVDRTERKLYYRFSTKVYVASLDGTGIRHVYAGNGTVISIAIDEMSR